MKKYFYFLLIILMTFACQNETLNGWQPKELMSYGLPVNILAPDSVVVKTNDMGGGIKDITIRGGKDYSIQIYASPAETTDIAKIKANELAIVKTNRYFSKIVMEEEAGFIYETAIDSSNINYGFRFIKVQGDLEIIFQPGMAGTFSLDEAEQMYEAVKVK